MRSEVVWRISFNDEGVAFHTLDLAVIVPNDSPFISSFHHELVLQMLDAHRVYDGFSFTVNGNPTDGSSYSAVSNEYVIDVARVLSGGGDTAKLRLQFNELNGANRIGNLWVYEPKFGLRLMAGSTRLTFAAPNQRQGLISRMFWRGERVWNVGPEPATVNQADGTVSVSFRDIFPSVGFAYPAANVDRLSAVLGFAGGVAASLVASYLYKLIGTLSALVLYRAHPK